MEKGTLLAMLTSYARRYRVGAMESVKRNKHMNRATGNAVDQRDVDALLTDFINTIGMHLGIDYSLYASDLAKEETAPVA